LFALAVLKERISFYQGVGIAVVIGSVFAMELQRAIRAPQPSREPV
jgi:drug/metabolite transporter (DMT)-like permease